MTTKNKMEEDLMKTFKEEIKLNLISKQKLMDFVQTQIMKHSNPKCFSCFDKGFMVQKVAFPDAQPRILYCPCDFGQGLKRLIASNYNPKGINE